MVYFSLEIKTLTPIQVVLSFFWP